MSKNSVPFSATGAVTEAGTVGVLNKIIVNTHSSGVIKVVDNPNSTAGRIILSDYTLTTGSQVIELDAEYHEGLYFVLVSGTATVQFTFTLGK